jgi:hypothetical protein
MLTPFDNSTCNMTAFGAMHYSNKAYERLPNTLRIFRNQGKREQRLTATWHGYENVHTPRMQ